MESVELQLLHVQRRKRSGVPRPVKGHMVTIINEEGCCVCGSKVSSSFRRAPPALWAGDKPTLICNSCHCKSYRLKRKLPQPQQDGSSPPTVLDRRGVSHRASVGAASPSLGLATALHLLQPRMQLLPVPIPVPMSPADIQLESSLPWRSAADPAAGAGAPVDAAAQATSGAGEQRPGKLLALQCRVLQEVCGSADDATLALLCARRAKQATPFCQHRAVLGVLPCLKLHMPDDPPHMMHSISCLVECVLPAVEEEEEGSGNTADSEAAHLRVAAMAAPAASASAAQGDSAGAADVAQRHPGSSGAEGSSSGAGAGGSCSGAGKGAGAAAVEAGGDADGGGQGQGQGQEKRNGDGVRVRLTVFAAAGAVACWYEGPPEPTLALGFSTVTKAPIWTGGEDGFSLHFPHPFCPQLDLFTAMHSEVAKRGRELLSQPTMTLDFAGIHTLATEHVSEYVPRAAAASPPMPAAAVPLAGLPIPLHIPLVQHQMLLLEQQRQCQQQHLQQGEQGSAAQEPHAPLPHQA